MSTIPWQEVVGILKDRLTSAEKNFEVAQEDLRRTETWLNEIRSAYEVAVELMSEIEQISAEAAKNPSAVALGKLGGAKGGKARAEKLSPERRSEIARKAAQARWSRKP